MRRISPLSLILQAIAASALLLAPVLILPQTRNRIWVRVSNNTYRKNHRQETLCLVQSSQSRGGFCTSINHALIGGNFYLDGKVCGAIEDVIGYSSVVDFGAGLGQYGRCFLRNFTSLIKSSAQEYHEFKWHLMNGMKKAGLLNKPRVIESWEGYDGAVDIERLTQGLVRNIDLSRPFDLGKSFDWVVSLEVGEHIPATYENNFLDNLVKHARKGIILSWAVPGQVGLDHINTRSNEYIISKMAGRGAVHDPVRQLQIRNITKSYFRNTVMVFRIIKEIRERSKQ